MNEAGLNKIRSLFEELDSINIAANTGNNKEPVWDGAVIGKPNQHTLVDMGLVECCHGYYFLTQTGVALLKLFRSNMKPKQEQTVTDPPRPIGGYMEVA